MNKDCNSCWWMMTRNGIGMRMCRHSNSTECRDYINRKDEDEAIGPIESWVGGSAISK